MIFLLSAGRHRQISTVTRFQAHPSGFLHWSRGPCSCAAGGSLLTGAILKARSAGGVSGSFGRSVVKPKLLVATLLSFVSSPTTLFTIGGGGGGDVTYLSPFGRKRHENSPYRGHIWRTLWSNAMNSGQAYRPSRGSCSPILGRSCFGDLLGDEIIVSPPSLIVEPLYSPSQTLSDF